MTTSGVPLRDAVLTEARPLQGSAEDYDGLLQQVGDARFVLLGEASHGTHEFYRERARITQRLIVEKNFDAVAVEADWPDAYRVNRYLHDASSDTSAEQALAGFERFPAWMWRNHDVLEWIEWLHQYNRSLPLHSQRVGFFGLDLYSLFTSIDEVLRYLDRVDPVAASRARERYACFEHFNQDSQQYAYETAFGSSRSCEEEVIAQLRELQLRAMEVLGRGDEQACEEQFHIEQNARLVKNAEEYYRTMLHGRVSSWNLRDRHMAETLDRLAQYWSSRCGRPAKLVVWEHNSHVGDARATELGQAGEWNVGQLVREAYGKQAVLIGFTTYQGTVTAAADWGADAERKQVRPALPDSYEAVFHSTGMPDFWLSLSDGVAARLLRARRLERAIGVVYRPETERQSHYFFASLPQQFDGVLHFDCTRAVQPLEGSVAALQGDAPETFPSGM